MTASHSLSMSWDSVKAVAPFPDTVLLLSQRCLSDPGTCRPSDTDSLAL
jgi:hypothetical protein